MSLSTIIEREKPEPEEGSHAIPLPMMALVVLITAFGVYYYAHFASDAPEGFPKVNSSPQAVATAIDGEKLFKTRCAACHQATGKGIPGAFPPLAGSEWVNGDSEVMASIVVHGLSGEIEVSGQTFKGAMPSFSKLKNEELAAILTYVRGSWGNSASEVTAAQVEATRDDLENGAWKGEKALRDFFGAKTP